MALLKMKFTNVSQGFFLQAFISKTVTNSQPIENVGGVFRGKKLPKSGGDFEQTFDVNTGVTRLFINQSFLEDEGEYTCHVQNTFGSDAVVAYLVVVG